MDRMHRHGLTRRQVLALAGAAMSAGLLAACSSSAPSSNAPAPTSAPAAGGAPASASKPTAQVGSPRGGGELIFTVNADPPSWDIHQESTWAVLYPTQGHYNLLVRFSQAEYPKIVPEIAESWTISPDGLVYDFKIRDGVAFHDGSILTSQDVKASYDHIISPPQGVLSPRKALYSAVDSVEAPDAHTVRFKLKYPSASLMLNLASPWNHIYKADLLAQDPHYYKKNVMGTGPFTFVEYVPGSHWIGKKNPNFYRKDRPYLDSFRAVFITDDAARVAAIRGGRSFIDFRTINPSAAEDLQRAMGDQVVIDQMPLLSGETAEINTLRKPFDDARVRRALTLAVDRWAGAQALSQVTYFKGVGMSMRPGSPFAPTDDQLKTVAGYATDVDKSRAEAMRLLQEAGVANGFSFTLLDRNVEPFPTMGIFLIDQWRRIGLNVEHQVLETGPYTEAQRAGNFEVYVGAIGDFADDPDQQLARSISKDRSPANYGGYIDRTLDDLFDRQSRELDVDKRKQLVFDFDRRLYDEMAYKLMGLWQQRIVARLAKVQGWAITPSYYINDITDIWLSA
jgi:peptide/nickel transport system substrate-binding protein